MPARIEIRDERDRPGEVAAWIAMIGKALERFERERIPFAVLVVELGETDGPQGEEPATVGSVAAATGEADTDALQELAASSAASLTRERPGRYWLVVPDTDRRGAQALAQGLSRAIATPGATAGSGDPAEQYLAALSVRRSPRRYRLRPLPSGLVIGIAACPQNGEEAMTLAAHAELELAAARARGASLISTHEPT